jgi:hypothetical protein
MKFDIQCGQSSVSHFEVYPAQPDDGHAKEWRVADMSAPAQTEVDSFDIRFRKKSTPMQRQVERMILVFTMAQPERPEVASWRFVHGGVMYCEGKADYRDDLAFEMSSDGRVLTATAKCLSDGDEQFQFSFLALRRDNVSGECQVYSSADPGGKIGRV